MKNKSTILSSRNQIPIYIFHISIHNHYENTDVTTKIVQPFSASFRNFVKR